jgi:hypothetical protein
LVTNDCYTAWKPHLYSLINQLSINLIKQFFYQSGQSIFNVSVQSLINTGVHFFRLECNTAMSVRVYYTLPGVRILNSSRFPMQPGQRFAERQDEQEPRGLRLMSRYPLGIVGMVLVCHLNVKGSIPTLTMIFLHVCYPRITYYWTVPLILGHSYVGGKLTRSNILDTKVSGFQRF